MRFAWILVLFSLAQTASTTWACCIGPDPRNGVALVAAKETDASFAKQYKNGVALVAAKEKDASFAKQYKKEIRPLLGRALTISHKEVLFVLLRVVLQASMTVANPNNPLLSVLSTAFRFLVDILFQFASLNHYKHLINNEFGNPRVAETRAIEWKDRIAGFVAIRGLQRLTFQSPFLLLYVILSQCSRMIAADAFSNGVEGLTLGFDISGPVAGTFVASLIVIALFKLFWGLAIKLTIADKVYLWNIGSGRDSSVGGDTGKGKGTGKGTGGKERVNVVQAVRASFRLVDELDASFLISRLSTLYIAPRILLAIFAPIFAPTHLAWHFLHAYQDVVFMVASHLLFLDRFLEGGQRGKR